MSRQINHLRFGDYTLDLALRHLKRQEDVLPVAGRAFDLLAYMVANPGRPLSKSDLLQAVWPDTIVEEANLTQYVSVLRKVLGPESNGLIKTLPGFGYQFAATVTEVAPDSGLQPAIQPGSSPHTPSPQTLLQQAPLLQPAQFHATHTRLIVEQQTEEEVVPERLPWVLSLALAAVVLALAGWLGWIGWQRWQDRTGGPPVQVVLTPMEGSTGDAVLDRTLVSALRMDLAQSPFVSTVPSSTVRATLGDMMRKPDDALDLATARDVCERTNSQAVLHGNIARVGQHFLLTEEASSCVDGSVLAEAKQEAANAEDLPHRIDVLAENLRRKLGESRRSVARFSAPLFPANTSSIAALKAYCESTRMAEQGKLPQAIDLLKEAIAADPQFAIAYNDLWAYYANTGGDPFNAREALRKAYSLRTSASPLERLTITAHYNMVIIGNLFESERNYQTWAQLYPRSIVAWNGLSLTQQELGQYSYATISAGRALALRPKYLGLLSNYALGQMSVGGPQAARATCDRAIAQGIDGPNLRNTYLKIAYLLNDPALLKAQRDWAAAHPEAASFALTEGSIALAEGRFAEAHQTIDRALELMRRQGLNSVADDSTRSLGVNFIEAGDVEGGTRMLRSSPPDPESGYDLVGLAEINDVPAAGAGLKAMQTEYPQATLWKLYWGPLIQAAIDTANHDPRGAVAQLEPTHLLDGRGLDLPMHRGMAYLDAGQPAAAEKEFRYVLAHREVDPVSYFYPLAWLYLGRSLAAEGSPAAADAYQHFLGLWAHADAGAPLLRQARQELASLQPVLVQH